MHFGEESFWYLLTDWNHWGVELVAETALFAVEVLILDRLLHRHDRRSETT